MELFTLANLVHTERAGQATSHRRRLRTLVWNMLHWSYDGNLPHAQVHGVNLKRPLDTHPVLRVGKSECYMALPSDGQSILRRGSLIFALPYRLLYHIARFIVSINLLCSAGYAILILSTIAPCCLFYSLLRLGLEAGN